MSKKNQLKSDVSRDGYNFYSILGFTDLTDKECEALKKKEIIIKLRTKLHKYHPERVPKDLSKEECADYTVMYNLVKKAGAVLTDPNRKKAYDMERTVNKSSTQHWKKRNDFSEFIKAQTREVSEEGRKKAELEFKNGLSEFKQKHGSDKYDDNKLTIEESKKIYETRDTIREQVDIEWMPEPIKFENNKFDHKKFMRTFEKTRMKKTKNPT